MERVRVAAGFVLWLCIAGISPPASAQGTYEVLRSLIEPADPPIGRLLEASNGKLYGVAVQAGPAGKGAILEYQRQSNGTLTATVLHAFSGPDGATPLAGVIEGSDGTLYGTTYKGGANGTGTIYRIAPDGSFSLLHSFGDVGGGYPRHELVEASDGNLYGSYSAFEGTETFGGIFRLTKAGAFSVIATDSSSDDALIDGGDGRLYGITRLGAQYGTVFSVTLDGVYTVLHAFNRPGPIFPLHLIDGRDGFLYGTTTDAYEDARTSFFRISRAGAFSVIFTSTAPPTTFVDLATPVRGIDGNFYGTTRFGGINNQGTLYRITPAGVFSILHLFQFSFGSDPNSLMQAADGTLFGSTAQGGFARRGAIFSSSTSGDYRPVHIFHGSDPLQVSHLLTGPDGSIYGSSCGGGALNAGTVFKLTSNGTVLTVLHSFVYLDGMCPSGPLAFGADGALYGTAQFFGLGGGGTAFRITTTGTFNVLRFFTGGSDGAWPSGLIRASDGNFYGTTSFGGANNAGTIFRIGTGGFTTLHAVQRTVSFVAGASPLIQASDGFLYGVAPWRPFRMTLAGQVTYFDPIPGLFSPLVEGADGNLYGTTLSDQNPGAPRPATLFRMTTNGVPTVLHTFARTAEDPDPCGTLLAAPDGTLYGTGCGDGTGNFPGSIFAFSGSGAPVTVHTFDPAVGSAPTALMLGVDGALYGGASDGGPTNRGGIFRLKLP